jgi:hypothetical protein
VKTTASSQRSRTLRDIHGQFDLRKKRGMVDFRRNHVVRDRFTRPLLEDRKLARQLQTISKQPTQRSQRKPLPLPHPTPTPAPPQLKSATMPRMTAKSADLMLRHSFIVFSLVCVVFFLVFGVVASGSRIYQLAVRAPIAAAAIMSDTQDALASLQAGEFEVAADMFATTSTHLSALRHDIDRIGMVPHMIMRGLPIGPYRSSGLRLLTSSQHMSESASHLSRAAAAFSAAGVGDQINTLAESETFLASTEGKQTSPDTAAIATTPIDAIKEGIAHIDQARSSLEAARHEFDRVHAFLIPGEYREMYDTLQYALVLLHHDLDQIDSLSSFLFAFLGDDRPRRYLLTFHNDNEIRSAFGFIGSYAILDIDQGRVSHIEFDDVYNLDGQLKRTINPPAPIAHLTDRFYLHDANWWADFPSSAERMEWYFEEAGGPTVDGIIALTPHIVEGLLAITGPIEMPDYDTTIDQHNFILATQNEVEFNYDRALNRPKKFLADLAPVLLDRLSHQQDKLPEIASVFVDALEEKYLAMYFSEPALQEEVTSRGWAGIIEPFDGDYLMIADNNIGGGKTSRSISQHVMHDITIHDDGRVTKKLTVTKIYRARDDIFTMKNINWTKVHVPEGSLLLDATGFDMIPKVSRNPNFEDDPAVAALEEATTVHPPSKTHISTESGKTVFGNWNSVEDGHSKSYEYEYTLPFTIITSGIVGSPASYRLFIQKQLGSVPHDHTVVIRYPEHVRPRHTYPNAEINPIDRTVTFEMRATSDLTIATVFDQ